MKTSTHWTPFETKLLRDKWAVLPIEEIKNLMDHPRTIKSISAKARRMGLPTIKRDGIRNFRLYFIEKNRDKKATELAEMLGLTPQYVRMLARENGIRLLGHGNRRHTTHEESEQIIDRYLAGERVVDIWRDYPHLKYCHVYSRVSKFISLGIR